MLLLSISLLLYQKGLYAKQLLQLSLLLSLSEVGDSVQYYKWKMDDDTGGRTVQALPKETQITGQMRRQKNYNYRESMFIIYLLYIE